MSTASTDSVSEHEVHLPGAITLAMCLLSLMAIVVAFAVIALELDPQMRELLKRIDTFLCVVFLCEFFIGLVRSPAKRAYLRVHWIDLLASIPLIEFLRWLRIFQIIRVIRTLRELPWLFSRLRENPAQLAVASILLVMIVMLSLCSVVILYFEQYADGPITTAADALWWGLVTVSTVGYGDYVPVTTAGKIVAGALIMTGVGLFGAMSGLVASQVLKSKEEQLDEELKQDLQLDRALEQQLRHQQNTLDSLMTEVRALRQEVAHLRQNDR